MMLILSILFIVSIRYGASKTCICNFNHPRVAVYECPSDKSRIISFMDQSDKNTFQAIDTDPPYCLPFLENVATQSPWAAVLVNERVGFVSRDYGERPAYCPGVLSSNETSLDIPGTCLQFTAPTTVPTVQASTTSTPILTSTATTVTKAMTTAKKSHVHCLKLESVVAVQQHEQVRHPFSRHCVDGESETEGVVYRFCNDTEMALWKKGLKVKDLCQSQPVTTFIAVASFFHDRPIDAGIFVGCSGGLEVFQQRCGTNLEYKVVTGYEADDYFTIQI